MSERTRISSPANPGASATAVLWDDTTYNTGVLLFNRILVTAWVDQNATFKHEWSDTAVGTLRTINGGGSGEAITLSTFFERDCLLMPGRNKLSITTVTNPTVWQIGVEGESDRSLGQ